MGQGSLQEMAFPPEERKKHDNPSPPIFLLWMHKTNAGNNFCEGYFKISTIPKINQRGKSVFQVARLTSTFAIKVIKTITP